MNEDQRLEQLLRRAIGPVGDGEPARDLWPDVRRRIERARPGLSWLDWTLAAAAAGWLLLFPSAIPGLLYHL
jgi:hypothetical protein